MIIDFGNKGNGGASTFPEAPIDGKTYGRKDASWVEVTAGGGEEYVLHIPRYTFRPADNYKNPEVIDLTIEEIASNSATMALLETKYDNGEETPNIIFREAGTQRANALSINPVKGLPALSEEFVLFVDVVPDRSYRARTYLPALQLKMKLDGTVEYISGGAVPFVGDMKTINGMSLLGEGNIDITGGGGGTAPVQIVVPNFDLTQNPITIKYDITPEDKTANIAAVEKIKNSISTGVSPNVVIRDNRKYGYFFPWKVNAYRDNVGIIYMQELYNNRREFVAANVLPDGSVQPFSSWSGADTRELKTVNGQSLVGTGDIQISGGSGLEDAPSDGKQYARQDASWTEVDAGKTFFLYIPNFALDPETGAPVVAQDITPDRKAKNAAQLKELAQYMNDFAKEGSKANIVFYSMRGPLDRVNVISYQPAGQTVDVQLLQKEFVGNLIVKAKCVPDGNWLVSSVRKLVFEQSLQAKGYITDAPSDGKQYARQDGAWTEVAGGASEETYTIYVPSVTAGKESSDPHGPHPLYGLTLGTLDLPGAREHNAELFDPYGANLLQKIISGEKVNIEVKWGMQKPTDNMEREPIVTLLGYDYFRTYPEQEDAFIALSLIYRYVNNNYDGLEGREYKDQMVYLVMYMGDFDDYFSRVYELPVKNEKAPSFEFYIPQIYIKNDTKQTVVAGDPSYGNALTAEQKAINKASKEALSKLFSDADLNNEAVPKYNLSLFPAGDGTYTYEFWDNMFPVSFKSDTLYFSSIRVNRMMSQFNDASTFANFQIMFTADGDVDYTQSKGWSLYPENYTRKNYPVHVPWFTINWEANTITKDTDLEPEKLAENKISMEALTYGSSTSGEVYTSMDGFTRGVKLVSPFQYFNEESGHHPKMLSDALAFNTKDGYENGKIVCEANYTENVDLPEGGTELRERTLWLVFDKTGDLVDSECKVFPVATGTGGGSGLEDAPSDGNQYARQDGAWTQVVSEGFPDAPRDGNIYARQNNNWYQIHDAFPDAPSDGKTYGRNNTDWVEVQAGGEEPIIIDQFADSNEEVLRKIKLWDGTNINKFLIGGASAGYRPVLTIYKPGMGDVDNYLVFYMNGTSSIEILKINKDTGAHTYEQVSYATKEYVDGLVGAANNRLNLI